MVPRDNGIYSKRSIMPNQNREGAMSGEEQFQHSRLKLKKKPEDKKPKTSDKIYTKR